MERNFYRYSKHNFSWGFFLGGLAMLLCVPYHWRAGDQLTALLVVALVAVIWGVAAWAIVAPRVGFEPVMLVTTLCNLGCLFALVHLGEVGIYWFYPLLMVIAYVMPWRWSAPINAANVIFGLSFAAGWMPDAQYYRLIATLLVALAFSLLFSYNMERQHEMLEDMSVTDPLTGAFNRRYFERELDEARRQWKRTGSLASMIMIDIDHFKQINDTYGHYTGDMCWWR